MIDGNYTMSFNLWEWDNKSIVVNFTTTDPGLLGYDGETSSLESYPLASVPAMTVTSVEGVAPATTVHWPPESTSAAAGRIEVGGGMALGVAVAVVGGAW